MAQRLMVARAILHRPAILFLDEPTAGLDPQSRIALWEILGDLHAQGQTILLTTHYMEEADQLCDRVAIMDHGRILALDTPAMLKAGVDVDSVVTLSTDGDLDALGKVLAADVPGVERVDIADGTLRVAISTSPGIVPALVTAADRSGFRVTDLSVTEVTLETVFINLTGKDLRD
jgi:ABC-2 type transport system ATP-binding protein